jgi:hypothetical protein
MIRVQDDTWPTTASGRALPFVAQLDLGSLPAGVGPKPSKGLLQLFYDGATNDHLVRVIPTAGGTVGKLPAGLKAIRARQFKKLLKAKPEYPSYEAGTAHHHVVKVDLDDYERQAVRMLTADGLKVGGWPRWLQDPEYPKGASGAPLTTLLLQLEGRRGLSFGDSGMAWVFCGDDASELGFSVQCY